MNTIIHATFTDCELRAFMDSRKIYSYQKALIQFLVNKGFLFEYPVSHINHEEPRLSGWVYQCRHDHDRTYEIKQIVSSSKIKTLNMRVINPIHALPINKSNFLNWVSNG